MTAKPLLGANLAAMLASCAVPAETVAPSPATVPPPALAPVDPSVIETEQAWLHNMIKSIREEHDLPALGAVILRPDGRDIGAVFGLRKSGTLEAALIDDAWHLGSNGKSMSALIAARLAERGMLSLDATMGEIFPELAKGWGNAAKGITVEQLATQNSGLRDTKLGEGALLRWRALPGSQQAKRRAIVDELLKAGPENPASDGFAYANINYVILGGVIEKVTGKPFEDLFRDELVRPLGLETAGFGAPKTGSGSIWGHQISGDDLVPVDPDAMFSDNPREIVAAGTAHMNLRDWARYAREAMAGATGKGRLLRPETYKRILTPKPELPGYAYGWGVRETPGVGRVMSHSGSNTMWFAYVRLFPDQNAGYLVTTNVAGERAEEAMKSAVEVIEAHFAKNFAKKEE